MKGPTEHYCMVGVRIVQVRASMWHRTIDLA
jgi:hypothetical protein